MSEPAKAAKPKFPLWRLLRFRLRTLLIVITVFGIAFGWWLNGVRRQQAAVAAIRQAKGYFEHDFQNVGSGRPAHVPTWLVDILGVDWFENVTAVQFLDEGCNWSEADMQHLTGLTSLQYLRLSDMQITDVGLERLKGLKSLRRLYLDGTQITDAGLEHLTGLTLLNNLYLSNVEITDAGLAHLRGLSSLQLLSLYNTKVTDAGVRRLNQALTICSVGR